MREKLDGDRLVCNTVRDGVGDGAGAVGAADGKDVMGALCFV